MRYDKTKQGYIEASHVTNIFRLIGQNPSLAVEEKLFTKALNIRNGNVLFIDLLNLFERYWKTADQMKDELREALLIFGSFFLLIIINFYLKYKFKFI